MAARAAAWDSPERTRQCLGIGGASMFDTSSHGYRDSEVAPMLSLAAQPLLPADAIPRIATIAGGESSKLLATPPGLPATPSNLPSVGSALHASGTCRPCSWFWKPGGCQNKEECCHCHLCPEGELKARKKHKQTMMRLGLATPKVDSAGAGYPDDAFAMETGADVSGALAIATQELEHESTTASGSEREELSIGSGQSERAHSLMSPQSDTTATHPCGEDLPPISLATSSKPVMLPFPAVRQDSEHVLQEVKSREGYMVPLPPGLQPPPDTPSHGSALHRLGICNPCAWFWKEGGCQNAEECRRCHLCPPGELKVRKKSKQTMLRLGLATPKASDDASTTEISFGMDDPSFASVSGQHEYANTMQVDVGDRSSLLRLGLVTPKASGSWEHGGGNFSGAFNFDDSV